MPDTTTLGKYLLDTVLKEAEANRLTLEAKWERNRKARDPEFYDNARGRMAQAEQSTENKDDSQFAVTKQKCLTAKAIVAGTVLRGGRVPLAVEPDAWQPPDVRASEAAMTQVAEAAAVEEHRIADALDACSAARELTACIDSGVSYGEYWVHAYVYDQRWPHYVRSPAGWERIEEVAAELGIEHVSVWEMFRDPETNDVDAMRYLVRSQPASGRELYDLYQAALTSDGPYLPWAIEEALKAVQPGSPSDAAENIQRAPPYTRWITHREKNIPRREFWCFVPARKADEFDRDTSLRRRDWMLSRVMGGEVELGADIVEPPELPPEEDMERHKMVPVFAVVANDHVIAYQRDPGKRPYNFQYWEPAHDNRSEGRSIADNLEYAQRSLNGITRAYNEVLKIVGKILLAARRSNLRNSVEQAMENNGILEVDEELCTDVRAAVQQIIIQDPSASLLKGLETWLAFADYEGHVPRSEQGQGSPTPQTAYELYERLKRSGQYLLECVTRFDDMLRWIGGQYYDWHMGDPSEAVGKGNFRIRPQGALVFDRRFGRMQRLLEWLMLCLNQPMLAKRARMSNLLREATEASDLDPDQVWKSDQELQEEAAKEEQSSARQLEQMQAEMSMLALRGRADRDQARAERDRVEAGVATDEAKRKRAETVAKIEREAASAAPVPPAAGLEPAVPANTLPM